MPSNSEILKNTMLAHFPQWAEFISVARPHEMDVPVFVLPLRHDSEDHKLSVVDRGDTFEIRYDDLMSRGAAEALICFDDDPDGGALAVVDWLHDFLHGNIVVARYQFTGLKGSYTQIFFKRRDEKLKGATSIISQQGRFDYKEK